MLRDLALTPVGIMLGRAKSKLLKFWENNYFNKQEGGENTG